MQRLSRCKEQHIGQKSTHKTQPTVAVAAVPKARRRIEEEEEPAVEIIPQVINANVHDQHNAYGVLTAASNSTDTHRYLDVAEQLTYTSRIQSKDVPSWVNSMSTLLGLGGKAKVESNAIKTEERQRELKARLAITDPTVSVADADARMCFVAGAELNTMRTSGIKARNLQEIGVTYTDWMQCGYGVAELVSMEASWATIVEMQFLPEYITEHRKTCGPHILAKEPLRLTFADLHQTLGLCIDEAVFDLNFTTADFQVLGESAENLIKVHGLCMLHAKHMRASPDMFISDLQASPTDLARLFETEQPVEETSGKVIESRTDKPTDIMRQLASLNNYSFNNRSSKRT